MFKWFLGGFAETYGKILSRRLKNYGLNYDDLLIECGDVQKALTRTSAPVRVLRERRIKRAIDVSAKKKTVPEEHHNYNPFQFYLQPKVEIVKLEKQERLLHH